jgi:hypothetical protein
MRLLVMSVLLLPLLAGASRADESDAADIRLNLRPATDIGPQASPAQGPAAETAIEVTGGDKASTSTLFDTATPTVAWPKYVLRGRVKYSGVEGDGYLEMWNDFGDKGMYFTRGLADWGLMKKLSGTSDWREFELPFYAEPGMKPRRLTLNVVLPGRGKVTVTEPLVVAALHVPGGWWNEQQSNWLGSGLGVLLGILGALIGLTSQRAKHRTLPLGLCSAGIAISVVSLMAGIVAICAGQPWHVINPLLMVGILGVIILSVSMRTITRRFEAEELRRMTAADVA